VKDFKSCEGISAVRWPARSSPRGRTGHGGQQGSSECTLIDHLQRAFGIEGELARKIVDVLLIKNRAGGQPDL
jgi:hypothetical protein